MTQNVVTFLELESMGRVC